MLASCVGRSNRESHSLKQGARCGSPCAHRYRTLVLEKPRLRHARRSDTKNFCPTRWTFLASLAVHLPGFHRRTSGKWDPDLHGRSPKLAGQHLHRATLEVGELRQGVPARVRVRPGGTAVASGLPQVLLPSPRSSGPRVPDTGLGAPRGGKQALIHETAD